MEHRLKSFKIHSCVTLSSPFRKLSAKRDNFRGILRVILLCFVSSRENLFAALRGAH